jgi:hypothetical protein
MDIVRKLSRTDARDGDLSALNCSTYHSNLDGFGHPGRKQRHDGNVHAHSVSNPAVADARKG